MITLAAAAAAAHAAGGVELGLRVPGGGATGGKTAPGAVND